MAAHGSLSSLTIVVFRFRGFVAVLGGGAAIEPQRSSSSCDDTGLTFSNLDVVLGAGAATAPHKSSSSAFDGFSVVFGLVELAAENREMNHEAK